MFMKLRVKELCKQKGITQKELAKVLGVADLTISRVNSGNASLPMLESIAAALHVPITELFAAQTDCKITCPHCGATLRVMVECETPQGLQPQP